LAPPLPLIHLLPPGLKSMFYSRQPPGPTPLFPPFLCKDPSLLFRGTALLCFWKTSGCPKFGVVRCKFSPNLLQFKNKPVKFFGSGLQ
jgi:hypothetical protein